MFILLYSSNFISILLVIQFLQFWTSTVLSIILYYKTARKSYRSYVNFGIPSSKIHIDLIARFLKMLQITNQ